MVKLLLRKDIPKLGLVGDLVNVTEGYARNYLIPHHLAVPPTKYYEKIVAIEKQKAAEERARRHAMLKQEAEKLVGKEITISAAANEEGHLYGSVGPRDIARALQAEGYAVNPDQVRMDEPIKRLDTVMVKIHMADDVEPEVKVWVVPEKTVGDLADFAPKADATSDDSATSEE